MSFSNLRAQATQKCLPNASAVCAAWGTPRDFLCAVDPPAPVNGLPVVRRVRLEDNNGVPVDPVP